MEIAENLKKHNVFPVIWWKHSAEVAYLQMYPAAEEQH